MSTLLAGRRLRYVSAYLGTSTNLGRADLTVLWAPSLLISSWELSNEVLISDCSLSYFFSRQEVVRALSSLVLPSKAVSLTDRAPVEATELKPFKCSLEELKDSVKYLLELSERLAGTGAEFPGITRQMLSHILSPTRLVLGDTKRFEGSISARVASSLIKDLVAKLMEFLSSGISEVVKVLYVVNLEKQQVFAVFGDKLVRNPVISLELSGDREALGRLSQLAKS